MFQRAETLLAAGQSVMLDATFIDPRLRMAAEDVAQRAAVPFQGLWLEAPAAVLEARVRARRGDASDADADVLRRQLARDVGSLGWYRLDADATPEAVAAAARRLPAFSG
jgi:predicted kinase